MKKRKILIKAIIESALIWIVYTAVFIYADDTLHLSKTTEWFPIIAVFLPILLAVCWFCIKLIKFSSSASQKDQKHSEALHNTPIPRTSVRPAASKPQPVPRSTTMSRIDKMDGHDFEHFTAELLKKLGYERVEVTPSSGDQGVDVIAVKDGKKYAIQCKRYGQKLGNKPVQEVHAGKTIYGCSVAVVLTNNYFTEGGKEAARALGVELWDRDKLERMLTYAAHMAGRSTC